MKIENKVALIFTLAIVVLFFIMCALESGTFVNFSIDFK